MTEFRIFPYNMASEGAKLLRDELDAKLIKREGSTYSPNANHVIINWGASDCPAFGGAKDVLNKTVKAALNKRDFFKRLAGTNCVPKHAFSKLDAADNLSFPIICRTKLEGHDGEGIVIAEKFSQLVDAKLYTQYVDKTSEYRIHVGRGPTGFEIIGSQKKFKKQTPDGPNVSPDSRLMVGDDHGLVWTVNGQPVFIPEPVKTVVKTAFEKFPELTFAAFDVIYNNSTSEAFVLEANTAPMGTPETMKRYGKFFRKLYPDATGTAATSTTGSAQAAGSTAAAGTSPAPAAPSTSAPLPVITVEQVQAAQAIINAYIQQQG